MKLEQKKQIVQDLKEDFNRSQSVAFVDYSGFKAGDLDGLRDKLLEVGGQLRVAKNTLIVRALNSVRGQMTNAKCQMENGLVGPTAIIFAFSDPLLPLGALKKFINEGDGLKFKGGIFEGLSVSSGELLELVEIPGRKVLLSQLAGLLRFPLQRFLMIAKSPMREFVGVCDTLLSRVNPPKP